MQMTNYKLSEKIQRKIDEFTHKNLSCFRNIDECSIKSIFLSKSRHFKLLYRS
ncbi:MAG: hypothetical protein PWQ17_432 [Anaerophaga sp.]|nr:hypothetical protein [Anaerophaga sp.]